MKKLNISIYGSSDLTASLITRCYDLGHEVVSVVSSNEDVVRLLEDLSINCDNVGDANSDLVVVADHEGELGCRESESGSVYLVCNREFDERSGKAQISWATLSSVSKDWVLVSRSESDDTFIYGADAISFCDELAIQDFDSLVSKKAKGLQWKEHGRMKNEKEVWESNSKIESLKSFHKSNKQSGREYRRLGFIERFISVALSNPSSPALLYKGKMMSYGEVYAKSCHIASMIRSAVDEIASDAPIAIMLKKSENLYCSILAVIRMKRSYVAIDPSYPPARVEYIVQNCGASIVITEKDLEESLSFMNCLVVDSLDEMSLSEISVREEDSFLNKWRCDDCLTIIYTSGSTGNPKGVKLSAGNLENFVDWYIEFSSICCSSRAFQFSSISFDASVLDIFPTWGVGACLVVPEEESRFDPRAIEQICRKCLVTHAFFPPSMLAELCPDQMPSLEFLATGGDKCDSQTVAKWSCSTKLVNIYGPTECTVLATAEVMSPLTPVTKIGRPVAGSSCYVLNDKGRVVKSEEIGELYISGAGVGLGYWNSVGDEGNRFQYRNTPPMGWSYRTGDLVSWGKDGALNYVGRTDSQVKVRGFRVELGEIESVINSSSLYKNCSVVVDRSARIVAYVSGPLSESSCVELLRVEVNRVLPSFMRPSFIVELEVFPLTPNGKIDRLKLSTKDVNESIPERVGEGEDGDTISDIKQIWSEILDIPVSLIGVDDSFFELGGHSLKVSKMLLSVSQRWGKVIPIGRFIANPSVRTLADSVEGKNVVGSQNNHEVLVKDMSLPPGFIESLSLGSFPGEGKILLTGATGFLGVFLLREILRLTSSKVVCLVRAKSNQEARKRVMTALSNFRIFVNDCLDRVEVVSGDVSMESMGLSKEVYDRLALDVSSIYHAAAKVNHVISYASLKEQNVVSVSNLLKFSVAKRNKTFNFVSTVAAASYMSDFSTLAECHPADSYPKFINNGYVLSKWVAEHMLWRASKEGLKVNVFRPGNIVGATDTGVCSPFSNRILLMLKGCMQMGYAPAWDMSFDFSPVDFVARSIVLLAEKTDGGGWFHLVNRNSPTWKEYVSSARVVAPDLVLEPPETWRGRLHGIDENNSIYQVIGFYMAEDESYSDNMGLIDCENTLRSMKDLGIHCPEMNDGILDRHFGYLVECGFFVDSGHGRVYE